MPGNFDLAVVLEPQAEGGFTVSVPALPEVVTEGDFEAEAMAMADEAIRAVLAYRHGHGRPIPGAAEPKLRKIHRGRLSPSLQLRMHSRYWRRCASCRVCWRSRWRICCRVRDKGYLGSHS